MKRRKQILSILMTVCMVLAMLPAGMVTAWAEEDAGSTGTGGTGKAIQLVRDGEAANIIGGQTSNVWFGSYNNSLVQWRVLKGEDNKALLLSNDTLDSIQFNPDYKAEDANVWAGSNAQKWCSEYYKAWPEGIEKNAILETSVTEFENYTYNSSHYGNLVYGVASLNNEHFFFLSAKEADKLFTDDNDRQASGANTHWWLRSPSTEYSFHAGVVGFTGWMFTYYVNNSYGARPAFNLNLNSVLFTSAAEGGKAGDNVLEPVNDYTGSDWKLTLLDSSREFSVIEKSAEVSPGGTVNLNYTNATINNETSPNEYISTILADKDGNLLYYGRLMKPAEADGQINVSLPDELEDGTYTLKLFCEQYNEDFKTDYASAFSDVELTVDSSVQSCPRDDTCPIAPFTDTDKNAWYHDGVHWTISKGIMYGTSKTTFEPMTSTTRAMLVTMLWRMEGSPVVDYQMTFTDVHKSQWYTEPIRWAAANGIVTGYNEETFGIDDAVTREQLATILYRSAQAKGKGFTGSWAFPLDFDDADQISGWANEAMHWMVMTGVMNGVSEKELSPRSDAVRAQVATMLMRFSERMS